MSKKALIAMSGGVDSSVTAYLMKERGFDSIGVTMKLFDNDDIGIETEKSCCSADDVSDAREVCHRLLMPHYVYNLADDFRDEVIGRFIRSYIEGATPNPCINCNRYMKFDKLFLRAKQLQMNYIVTGHYARVHRDEMNGRFLLKKAVDSHKDQSYVLYSMTQEQLASTIFPLGELCKTEVRKIAAEQGFINAAKRDSQDICFVKGNDYAGFIEQYTGKTYEHGDFVDVKGNILGKHKGLIRYTIGQRKGLGVAFGKPMYVCAKNIENNTVTLCDDSELYTKSLHAADFNWVAYDKVSEPIRIKAKIRYNHTEQWATAEQISEDTVHIEFDQPQRAIAKGQAVVLYDGDIVVGGGTII